MKRNRITAGLLSLLFGGFGIHKLYLRDTGGFMMFIFLFIFTVNMFRLPITAILGVFEAFRLFGMTDEEFDKKYNRGIIRPKARNVDRRREEQLKRYQNENINRGYEKPAPKRRVRSNPFKSSGMAKYKDFDLDGAIDDFNKGLEVSPDDIALHFNIACAYSLTEQKELAYQHLAKAVSLGFNDFDRIMSHDDLAYIRIQPEFDQFKASGFRGGNASRQKESDVQVAEVQDDVLLSQLNRLSELKNKGILTEDEFLREKNKLFNKR